MALTRGSRAAPLIASLSSRGRSASNSHGRLSGKRLLSSPPSGMTPSSSFEGKLPERLQDEAAEENLRRRSRGNQDSSSSRTRPVFKSRGNSHNRSSSGIASENRPVRLPKSLKPPSYSRTKGHSRPMNPPRTSRLVFPEENRFSATRSSAPATTVSSSTSKSVAKSEREVLKQSLRVNVLNNQHPSNIQSTEDFSEMSPKSLRAHLGFSPRANSPSSSIYSAHHPSEIRTYLDTPPTPRSSSPISFSNIKARFSGLSNGSRTSLLSLNGSRPTSPANQVNGMVAYGNDGATQSYRSEEAEEGQDQDQNISSNFRSDESVSSWTDRSENSEDGNSDDDDLSSFTHQAFEEPEGLDEDQLALSNALAPSLSVTSPKMDEATIQSKDESGSSFVDSAPQEDQDPVTPSYSDSTFNRSPEEVSSEWKEVLPRRSATFRRQGSSSNGTYGKRLSTPDKESRSTPPPLDRIPVRSSSSTTIAGPRSQSPSISSSPSTPNNSRFLNSNRPTSREGNQHGVTTTSSSPSDPYVQRPHSPAHHSPLASQFSPSRFKPHS